MEYFDNVDTNGAVLIGSATTQRPESARWTELQLYWLPAAKVYGAVINGMSDIDGEVDKITEHTSPNFENAISVFNDTSIARITISQARDWIEANQGANSADDSRARLVQGEITTDHEALIALYGENPSGRKGYSGLLASDFGVKESTARAAIANGTPIKVPLVHVLPFIDMAALAAAREKMNG